MTLAIVPLLSLLALAAEPGPCELVKRADVVRILHWSVDDGRESTYRLPQSSGWRCTYQASEGSVFVVAPNSGSSFLQNNDLVDPFRNGLGTRITGLRASVQMFDNAVYVNKHGKSVSVTVVTQNGTTLASTLTALAKIVAQRMP